MKKVLFCLPLLMLSLVLTNQASAQVGIRGGVNIANLNDTEFNVDSHTGLMAGFYFDYAIANSPVMIQPEVLYSQKGFENEADTYAIDYVEIPVLAQFNFFTGGRLRPFVYAGPYLGFKIHTDTPPVVIEVAPGPPVSRVQRSFNEGDINPVDFGVTVGAGLDFGRIDLGVRYEAGLSEISDDDNVSAKNGVFSIIGGIGF